jgi:PAS domain S-box-containing protein
MDMNIERTPTARRLVDLSIGPAQGPGSGPLPAVAESGPVAAAVDQQLLIEALPDAVIVTWQGLICRTNQRAETLFGRSREELLGYQFSLLFSDRDRGALAPGGSVSTTEDAATNPGLALAAIRRNGEEFPVEAFITHIAAEGYPAIVVLREGIGQHTMEKEIEIRARELEQASSAFRRRYSEKVKAETDLRLKQKLEAIGQLAAGIAHEINTPMQYISDSVHFLQQSFCDLLVLLDLREEFCRGLGSDPGPEVMETEERSHFAYLRERAPRAFARTIEGIDRVSSIVRAMKEFSHPYTDEKTPTDLNKALGYALMIARNEYKYVAEVETDFGDLPLIPCHSGDMNQVFLNLIVNAGHAIAASGQKGVIRVRTRHEHNGVLIHIEDTGTGIPENVRHRIFEPFFTTKPVGKGTGQGLAIAHSIVAKHGGALTFRTEMGRGTTFTIHLPTVEGFQTPPRLQ